MTTVISWEIIERWVTISKMKLTLLLTPRQWWNSHEYFRLRIPFPILRKLRNDRQLFIGNWFFLYFVLFFLFFEITINSFLKNLNWFWNQMYMPFRGNLIKSYPLFWKPWILADERNYEIEMKYVMGGSRKVLVKLLGFCEL